MLWPADKARKRLIDSAKIRFGLRQIMFWPTKAHLLQWRTVGSTRQSLAITFDGSVCCPAVAWNEWLDGLLWEEYVCDC